MSDFLQTLVKRSDGSGSGIQPRTPSLFEPVVSGPHVPTPPPEAAESIAQPDRFLSPDRSQSDLEPVASPSEQAEPGAANQTTAWDSEATVAESPLSLAEKVDALEQRMLQLRIPADQEAAIRPIQPSNQRQSLISDQPDDATKASNLLSPARSNRDPFWPSGASHLLPSPEMPAETPTFRDSADEKSIHQTEPSSRPIVVSDTKPPQTDSPAAPRTEPNIRSSDRHPAPIRSETPTPVMLSSERHRSLPADATPQQWVVNHSDHEQPATVPEPPAHSKLVPKPQGHSNRTASTTPIPRSDTFAAGSVTDVPSVHPPVIQTRTASKVQPTVTVTIGRIELQSDTPSADPVAQKQPKKPSRIMSLEKYLEMRS